MKRKSAWLSFAACALMATHPVKAAGEKITVSPQAAKPVEAVDFSKVEMMPLGNGTVGFFDRSTGTMYIYDSSFSQCIAIKKLNTLGAPAESIHT